MPKIKNKNNYKTKVTVIDGYSVKEVADKVFKKLCRMEI